MLMEKFPKAIGEINWYQHRNPFHVLVDEGADCDMMHLLLEHASIDLINDPYSGTKMPELTPLQYITKQDISTCPNKYVFMLFLTNCVKIFIELLWYSNQ